MDGPRFLRLELLAPLLYTEDRNLKPFDDDTGGPGPSGTMAGEERIFLFEIDPVQGLNIEPDPDVFLGPLVFAGKLKDGEYYTGQVRELPAGRYLFAQEKRILNRKAGIGIAIEVQKDGLWERLTPEPKIYFRYLFEDGQNITQVFRPYKGENEAGFRTG
jgi:hypothetical protein